MIKKYYQNALFMSFLTVQAVHRAAIARETSFEEMQVLKIPSKMYYSSSLVVLLRTLGRSENPVGGQVAIFNFSCRFLSPNCFLTI